MSFVPVPRDLAEVSPQWLTRALTVSGVLHGQHVITVDKLAHADLSWIEVRLDLRYSDDSASCKLPPSMWLKLSKDTLSKRDSIRGRTEMQFMAVPNADMVANMDDPPTLRCYGSGLADPSGRLYVLLEDPTATHRPHRGPLPLSHAHYAQAISAIARTHAFWWDHAELDRLCGLPTREDLAAYKTEVREVLTRFLGAISARLSGQRQHAYWHAACHLDRFVPRLVSARNLTLVHGDLDLHNIIYPAEENKRGAILINWAHWAVDLASHDLSYLLVLHNSPQRRRQEERYWLRRYHQDLMRHGVRDYAWRELWHDYRLSMVDLIFWPMWQWNAGLPPATWWPQLSRIFEAYEDLRAAETLT